MPHATPPPPHTQTVEGSLACFVASAVGMAAFLAHFSALQLLSPALPLTPGRIAAGSVACSLAATLVESLPVAELDNLTVPAAAALTAALVFRQQP